MLIEIVQLYVGHDSFATQPNLRRFCDADPQHVSIAIRRALIELDTKGEGLYHHLGWSVRVPQFQSHPLVLVAL